jgi:hypothetical protein
MSWAGKMSVLVNDKKALKEFIKDTTSVGNVVSLTS